MPKRKEKVENSWFIKYISILFSYLEVKHDAQQKGLSNFLKIISKRILFFLAGELKDQASQKVDQAKDKANELASDAKKKGEGK